MKKKDLVNCLSNLPGKGEALQVEDLNITLKVKTFWAPYYPSWWKRLWLNFRCGHKNIKKDMFSKKYCNDCHIIIKDKKK